MPQITGPRHRIAGRLGCFVIVVGTGRFLVAFRLVVERGHQVGQFLVGEAGQPQVEAVAVEGMQFGGQQFLVPASVQGQLVVCQDIGAALSFGQVVEDQHRHGVEAKLFRRRQPPVAGDDVALAIGENGIGEAELDDAGGDLRHLAVRMCPRIAVIGAQPVDRPTLDRVGKLHGSGNRDEGGNRGGTRTAGYRAATTRPVDAKDAIALVGCASLGGNW
jgi:hypothetical protein